MGGLGNVHIIGHAAPSPVCCRFTPSVLSANCAIEWQRTRARVVHYPIGDAERNDKCRRYGVSRRGKVS
jgi:hypothetical protein